jgi:phosphatidylethanolamine/phosphatidyl-N-methylethanolamine N-methyltransferase
MARSSILTFAKEGWKHYRDIGTLFPCSKRTARNLARYVENTDGPIVEFGAGTGVVTNALLKKLSPFQRLLSFEINPVFCGILREQITNSRLQVINDCAANLGKYLNERAERIISVLPLGLMDEEFKARLFDAVWGNLTRHGRLVQFQYVPLGFENYRLVKDIFGNISWETSLWNIPPGWIYSAEKI